MPSITCVEGYIPLLMCMNSLLNDSHVLKTVVLWRIASIQGGIFFFFSFLPNREIQFNVIKLDMWFAIKFFAVHNWKCMFFIKQSWQLRELKIHLLLFFFFFSSLSGIQKIFLLKSVVVPLLCLFLFCRINTLSRDSVITNRKKYCRNVSLSLLLLHGTDNNCTGSFPVCPLFFRAVKGFDS